MKRLIVSFAIWISGCATTHLSIDAVPGEYEMGGFNEVTTLSLYSDGSYRISQWMMACVIDENGNITIWQDEESGRWRFEAGVISLETAARAPREYYAWFSRLRVSRKGAMKVLLSDVPTAPVYGRRRFTEKPNKAPAPAFSLQEPTQTRL